MPSRPDKKVNLPTSRLAHCTIDANFHGFSRCVCQTLAVDVVMKGSQTVVSRSEDKCVTRLVGEMISVLSS